jgi:uncharacterized SAM-binding protein YcdF (DUF218 family)
MDLWPACGALIILSWLLMALFLDAYGRRPLPAGSFDAIVVPGCAVRKDGTASGALARRTAHAIKLWHEGAAPRIVFTGGVGRYPPSEAMVAGDLALAAGIPREAIILEEQSTTTEANARLAAGLSAEMSDWHIVVTTDGYHCWRCRRLFGRHFRRAETVGSTPGRRLRFRGALREVVSIVKMLVRH